MRIFQQDILFSYDKSCLIQSQFFTCFWWEMKANTMDYDYKSPTNNTHIAVLVSYFILRAWYSKIITKQPK